jgi:hypothetical protein
MCDTVTLCKDTGSVDIDESTLVDVAPVPVGSSTTFSNVVQSISDITVSSDKSNITANKVGQERRTGLTSTIIKRGKLGGGGEFVYYIRHTQVESDPHT